MAFYIVFFQQLVHIYLNLLIYSVPKMLKLLFLGQNNEKIRLNAFLQVKTWGTN